jgi:hypothetical protein
VKKKQRKNNSIVIFSPGNDTVHAVKANYDHLAYQRTQLYGNLWFKESLTEAKPEWEDIVIDVSTIRTTGKLLLSKVRGALKKPKGMGAKPTHSKRKY